MIELAKANPDQETLKLMLWIAGSIIGLMIVIIGWLIEKSINSQQRKLEYIQKEQDAQIQKVSAVVDTLLEAVNSLKTIVEVLREQQSDVVPRNERRLNEHSKRLDVLDIKVAKAETRLNNVEERINTRSLKGG